MLVERWHPFSGTLERLDPLRDIQTEANRLFDSFFGRPRTLAGSMGTERLWTPVADLYETKDDLVVTLEVAGVRENDIAVSITGDLLTVKGERKFEREIKNESYHRLERTFGKFERTIRLPMPVQCDKVKATYRDGVLEIKLPKVEEVKPKEIKIDIP